MEVPASPPASEAPAGVSVEGSEPHKADGVKTPSTSRAPVDGLGGAGGDKPMPPSVSSRPSEERVASVALPESDAARYRADLIWHAENSELNPLDKGLQRAWRTVAEQSPMYDTPHVDATRKAIGIAIAHIVSRLLGSRRDDEPVPAIDAGDASDILYDMTSKFVQHTAPMFDPPPPDDGKEYTGVTDDVHALLRYVHKQLRLTEACSAPLKAMREHIQKMMAGDGDRLRVPVPAGGPSWQLQLQRVLDVLREGGIPVLYRHAVHTAEHIRKSINAMKYDEGYVNDQEKDHVDVQKKVQKYRAFRDRFHNDIKHVTAVLKDVLGPIFDDHVFVQLPPDITTSKKEEGVAEDTADWLHNHIKPLFRGEILTKFSRGVHLCGVERMWRRYTRERTAFESSTAYVDAIEALGRLIPKPIPAATSDKEKEEETGKEAGKDEKVDVDRIKPTFILDLFDDHDGWTKPSGRHPERDCPDPSSSGPPGGGGGGHDPRGGGGGGGSEQQPEVEEGDNAQPTSLMSMMRPDLVNWLAVAVVLVLYVLVGYGW